MITGVLLVDKPSGPTSHDVVARIRRTSGERRIGHTGTLDPRATGLLPLVLGQATRIASFLTGSDKTYDATLRLGFATDTDDADGQPIGTPAEALPDDPAIDEALNRFKGTFDQRPPAHSAKKIAGQKAYELARRASPVALMPVPVTVRSLERLGRDGDAIRVRVVAAAGFYVRALARDLGEALGCGAHLSALRRTHSGTFSVDDALPLEEAERLGAGIGSRLLSPAEALPQLATVTLTAAGLKRASHGNPVGPEHLAIGWIPPAGGAAAAAPVKLMTEDGTLLALAHSRGGALHPVVVLG